MLRLLAFLVTALTVLAQTPPQPHKKQPESKPPSQTRSAEAQFLWERANYLTSEILQDGAKLDTQQHAVLLGRMAEVWKNADPARAKAWQQQALDAVLTVPQSETAQQRKKRIAAEAALFEDALSSDPAAANRLLDSMISSLPKLDDPRTASRADAELDGSVMRAVMNGASDMVREQPQRALEMIERLFSISSVVSGTLPQSYLDFKSSPQPQFADQLLNDAVASFKSSGNMTLLADLSGMASPQPGLPDNLKPTAAQKQQISELVGQWMSEPSSDQAQRERICRFSGAATRLLPQMAPERQGQVQATIGSCMQAGLILPAAQHSEETSSKPPEEALESAGAESDVRQRAHDKVNAALRFAQKDPVRALAILDGLSEEEKRAFPQWQLDRGRIADHALSNALHAHDAPLIRNLIAASPDADKPELLLNLSLRAAQQKDDALAISSLREARELIPRTDFGNEWSPCVALLNRYAQLMPEQAPLVAREAMACLNNMKTYTDEELSKRGYSRPPFADGLHLPPLHPAVAGIDPQALDAAISLLEKADDRVVMRIGVLHEVLDRYTREIKPATTPR